MPYPFDDTQQLVPFEDLLNDVYASLLAAQAARIQAGTITIVPSGADVLTSAVLTFPVAFPSIPVMSVTPDTGFPGSIVKGWSFNSLTTTGCVVWLLRSNTTSTRLNWTAILP